ncbi:hypothetical protein [Microbulbifer sp. A4B17]|uniref:hypothetical protein n=1 Tax=Microbulbifer sp. A4B17 TaxID=359370 RepID=UPI0013008043|nr:hypothetical protein [Microbulbifer sp. A4B17]
MSLSIPLVNGIIDEVSVLTTETLQVTIDRWLAANSSSWDSPVILAIMVGQ